jgi:hypothetical protein
LLKTQPRPVLSFNPIVSNEILLDVDTQDQDEVLKDILNLRISLIRSEAEIRTLKLSDKSSPEIAEVYAFCEALSKEIEASFSPSLRFFLFRFGETKVEEIQLIIHNFTKITVHTSTPMPFVLL